MNDTEREQWVLNDEGLYEMYLHWRRRNKGGMRGFIRTHRRVIDGSITPILTGVKRAHHLLYG